MFRWEGRGAGRVELVLVQSVCVLHEVLDKVRIECDPAHTWKENVRRKGETS